MDEIDEKNAAVSRQLQTPPAMLEEVANDPRALSVWARKLLLVQMNTLHRKLADPTVSIASRQAFAEFLGKVGDAYPKASSAGGAGSGAPGFSVNIILGDRKASSSTTYIPADLPKVEVIENEPTGATAAPAKND